MNTHEVLIRIYELKLEKERLRVKKERVVRLQYWEEASKYRDLEKVAVEELLEIQDSIIKQLSEFDFSKESMEDYLALNELLLEFYPIELKRNAQLLKSLPQINNELAVIWNARSLLFLKTNEIIQNEYCDLIKKRGELIQERKFEEADVVLKKLMGLGEVIKRLHFR